MLAGLLAFIQSYSFLQSFLLIGGAGHLLLPPKTVYHPPFAIRRRLLTAYLP